MKIKKNTALIFTVSGAALVIAVSIIAIISLMSKKDEYRTLQIYQLDGSAEVERSENKMNPYVNMMLESGDRVSTFDESYLYLKADSDKFIMAEPNTVFSIEATGTQKNSRTKIDMTSGSMIFHVASKLSSGSEFTVDTPNSTMAIRGTSFRVQIFFDEKGEIYTLLQVFEGAVEARLVFPDGRLSDEAVTVMPDHSALIHSDNYISEFVYDSENIDYEDLDIRSLEFLKTGIEKLNKYSISKDEVDYLIKLKSTYFDVTFMYSDNVFGTQSVLYRHYAVEPLLIPTTSGHWDFDFTTAIKQNTVIQWIEE